MGEDTCPICGDTLLHERIAVSVRRGGQTVLRLTVPVGPCDACGHVAIDDEVQEEALALLERHSEPGDDIIFPVEPGP